MGAALLASRLPLAGVFLVAGFAKLADLAGSRRAVVALGVPERLAVLGTVLPLVELAVGVALVPAVSARFGALAAIGLLACFCTAIANAIARGRAPDCHCFGQLHSAPAGWGTLARNLTLLSIAGFVAIAGWGGGGDSATRWVTRVGAGWLVAIAAGAVIVALVSFQVWFSLQLLSQNGRVLGRVEALEAALERSMGALGVGEDGGTVLEPLGAGLRGAGLAVGSPAPDFDLESIVGERASLASLLSSGRRVMLVFSDSGCGPCDALMPDVARWQREHHAQLQIAVIASGDVERNREKATRHQLARVLLQSEREVANAYQSYGTPTAVVIGTDGLIASPSVAGSEAITKLTAQATRTLVPVRQHAPSANGHAAPSANGHANGSAPPAAPSPDRSRVGQPAPELVLADLDGARVALKDLYQERTLAVFWNPSCGFCRQMLPALRAIEENPPSGSPRLVAISAGDASVVREQGIPFRVVLDGEGEAMRAFGAGGTPMAVLVEQGLIASPVAAGADAILTLIRAAARSDAHAISTNPTAGHRHVEPLA
jgi:thiol-disulfide isomerase/thioredoxin